MLRLKERGRQMKKLGKRKLLGRKLKPRPTKKQKKPLEYNWR